MEIAKSHKLNLPSQMQDSPRTNGNVSYGMCKKYLKS